MIPSKASTISSSRSTASGFSILAMTGRWMPTLSMIWWTSLTSSGARTNDSAMKSTPELQRELEVVGVLVRHRRNRDRDSGQRQALVVADHAALGDVADDVGAVLDRDRDQRDVAVVDQQPVARADVVGQLLVGGRHPVVVAGDVLDGDPDPLAGRPLDRAVGEPAEPDLGALQVGQHGDVAPGQLGGPAHLAEAPAVLLVLAVAEVEPGDVHARVDEGAQPLEAVGGRTQGADDLRAACHMTSVSAADGRGVTTGRRHPHRHINAIPGVAPDGQPSAAAAMTAASTSSPLARARRVASSTRL